MYAERNYGNVNVSKAAGGYWKAEEDIREYATLYSPLSDNRECMGESTARLKSSKYLSLFMFEIFATGI